MAPPAGFTQLLAANIQDATGTLCVAGTLNILPTDGSDQPIGITAGGAGGPVAAVFATPIAIANGALPANAWVPDVRQTSSAFIGYRFVFKDAVGQPFLVWRNVQPTGPSFNLDTYTVPNPAQAPYTPGPTGPTGPMGALIPPDGVNLINKDLVAANTAPGLIGSNTGPTLQGASTMSDIPVGGAAFVTSNEDLYGDSTHGLFFHDAGGVTLNAGGAIAAIASTSFTEGAVGANLVGTHASGPASLVWQQAAGGTSPTFLAGGGIAIPYNGNAATNAVLLDAGVHNAVLQLVLGDYDPFYSQIQLCVTDANNYIAVNLNGGGVPAFYDVTNGNAVALTGSSNAGSLNGSPGLTFTVTGTSFTYSDGLGGPTITYTLPSGTANGSATKYGFNRFGTNNGAAAANFKLTSLLLETKQPYTYGHITPAGTPLPVPPTAVTLTVPTMGDPAAWMLVRGTKLPATFQPYWLSVFSAQQVAASAAAASGSARVVYLSALLKTAGDSTLTPGAGVTGVDRAPAIQTKMNGGNVKIVVDGQYTLGATLIFSSNTFMEILPGCGFIMAAGSNCEMFLNAHQNAPTTAGPNGDYLVSNQTDQNIFILNNGILNFNSTGSGVSANAAVTGADSTGGNNANIPNKDSPTTNLQVNGMRFVGVNGLYIEPGELYDAATFTICVSNVSSLWIDGKSLANLHHPQPLVIGKNTDGIHFYGPVDRFVIANIAGATGDDFIGLNADDVQEPGTFNDPYYRYPGVLHGPITNGVIRNVKLTGCLSGIRMLSLNSLIDNILIENVYGTTLSAPFTATKYFASGGLGNFGRNTIRGFRVACSNAPSSLPWDPVQAILMLDGNAGSWDISGLDYEEPSPLGVPLLTYGSGKCGHLALADINVKNLAGAPIQTVLNLGGKVSKLSLNGAQIDMAAGWTGSVLGGPNPPDLLAASNYNGPPANLLSPAWTNVTKTGDAFTPATGAGTTYLLRTDFTEGATGASLAGTTPATFAGTGAWTQTTGAAPVFTLGGVNVPCVGASDACVIDVGVKDYTASFTLASLDAGWTQFVLRYTDRNNYVALNLQAGSIDIYDGNAGNFTQILGTNTPPPTNVPVTVKIVGTQLTLNDGVNPPHTISLASGSPNTTSRKVGFIHYGSGSGNIVMAGMSVTA